MVKNDLLNTNFVQLDICEKQDNINTEELNKVS